MKLGIDGNEANVENRVGSNVYAFQILRYLHKRSQESDENQYLIYLKNPPLPHMPKSGKNWNYLVFGPKKLWTQWRLPLKLLTQKVLNNAPDIFFTPGHYAPRFSPIPTVISIMDLAFLKFPNEFLRKDLNQLKAWTKYSAQKAAHIFTISNASKEDIKNFYKISPEKITVTYPAATIKEKNPQDKSYQHLSIYLDLKKPYLIYIGTLQPRKNLIRLIQAFSQVKIDEKYREHKLLIVGKKGWLFDEIFQKVKELNLENEVLFTGYVTEYEKEQLLKNAQLFILPSLYEGFGIPLLEAMKMGTPVLASHTSSLPEVGEDAISYIKNPESIEEIRENMLAMLQLTEEEKNEIIIKQKKQSQKFSWESCGQKTLETLKKIVETQGLKA
jgi:glycosyltransferase involved in cell wall biosynthesis